MHIPRAICVRCSREMMPVRVGVCVEMLAGFGSYYKIDTDELGCSVCGYSVFVTADAPICQHWHPAYGAIGADVSAVFHEGPEGSEESDGENETR